VTTDITDKSVRPLVASVWLVHGLYNKLLGGSPRHLAIVQSVPGLSGAAGERVLTMVGLFEVGLALWILSGRAPLRCAATQTAALLSMNVVELTFARHLQKRAGQLARCDVPLREESVEPRQALRTHP